MPEKRSVSAGAKSSATLSNSLLSSPPRAPSSRSKKERRNPSVTPKRFGRFFTPRSRVSSEPSAARKALRALAGPELNRSLTPSSSPLKSITEENNDSELPTLRNPKRRKTHHTPTRSSNTLLSPLDTSPLLPTPELTRGLSSPIRDLQARRVLQDEVDNMDLESEDEEDIYCPTSPVDRRPLRQRGFGGELLQRMYGGVANARSSPLLHPVADWRTSTADFYTRADDAHVATSLLTNDGKPTIAFCTASCHTNSLVAVGDEDGYVRLLDSSKTFSKIHLSWPVHGNAIIDLDFSEDDFLLATAGGDQRGKVIDMMTQTPITVLNQHTASLKQVRFQPGRGGGCVLATSARDGTVRIWDLRCRGAVQEIPSIEHEVGLRHRLPRTVTAGVSSGRIHNAHFRPVKPTPGSRVAGAAESARGATVTALQFLPSGREHLLLTACDADSSIKLWDIRAVHSSRNSTPVSFTAPPPSHTWRHFGISAMTLSGDGARLYSVCKDNTVYAYSTAHLVLGPAPELIPAEVGEDPPRRRLHHGPPQEGLGPMYGFRHPKFHANSFYVKTAIRPALDGREELLAVGSSDGCAVLFPTHERFVRDALRRSESVHPSTGRVFSASFNSNLGEDETVPLIQRGTPLIRGHSKEVGALTWTNEGQLVTGSDDFFIRCWHEDREQAKDLRLGGEVEGRRWGCGWADVGEDWDGDKEEWVDAEDDDW